MPSMKDIGSKYGEAHADPQGPGDNRPTAFQIIQDEDLLQSPNRLLDKTILITGGTSGLGLEVAKALHATGAKVSISGRCDVEKGQQIAASINSADYTGNLDKSSLHAVQFVYMDLSDLSSVQTGAASFLKQSNSKLNLLICNAGVMAPQSLTRTVQGHETQFGVNHLAHFFLFKMLCPTLLECSTQGLASRVIMVSSCAHRNGGLNANNDYAFEDTPYDAMLAYGQSKTANVYMASEIERRFGAQGLHSLSVHPGVIMETGLVRHLTDDYRKVEAMFTETMPTFAKRAKSAQQGAGCIVWAAIAESLEGKGGMYTEDCSVGEPVEEGIGWDGPGTAEWCYNKAAEEKLWFDSEKMVETWL